MQGKYYLFEEKENVVTITLNRPEIHNAFNDELISELTNCFLSLSKDKKARVIVLTGKGKSFCAGADLNWMKSMKDYSDTENFEDSKKLSDLFHAINDCPIPVIAKVNGAALGGGTGLIAACDFVIACKSAKFGFTEVRLGLVPAVISPFVIAKIGESNSRAWFLSGEMFLAEEAKHIGLVHSLTPLDDLDNATEKVIEKFLKAAPIAAREAKELISNVVRKKPADITKYTCETISRIRISDEGQEGMSSLLNKTKPNWIS